MRLHACVRACVYVFVGGFCRFEEHHHPYAGTLQQRVHVWVQQLCLLEKPTIALGKRFLRTLEQDSTLE